MPHKESADPSSAGMFNLSSVDISSPWLEVQLIEFHKQAMISCFSQVSDTEGVNRQDRNDVKAWYTSGKAATYRAVRTHILEMYMGRQRQVMNAIA